MRDDVDVPSRLVPRASPRALHPGSQFPLRRFVRLVRVRDVRRGAPGSAGGDVGVVGESSTLQLGTQRRLIDRLTTIDCDYTRASYKERDGNVKFIKLLALARS